jgi:hypothetical protein
MINSMFKEIKKLKSENTMLKSVIDKETTKENKMSL